MELESSFPCLQQPAPTMGNIDPVHNLQTYLLKLCSQSHKRFLRLRFSNQISCAFLSLKYVPHARPIFLDLATLISGNIWLRAGRPGFDPRRGQRIFPLASVSRPALGPIQPPVQWVPGVLSPGVKRGRGVTLTTHPHLVPRSWMSRSYTSSPPKRHHSV